MVIFNSYVKLPEGNYHTCIMHHVDKGVLHVCGIDAKLIKNYIIALCTMHACKHYAHLVCRCYLFVIADLRMHEHS